MSAHCDCIHGQQSPFKTIELQTQEEQIKEEIAELDVKLGISPHKAQDELPEEESIHFEKFDKPSSVMNFAKLDHFNLEPNNGCQSCVTPRENCMYSHKQGCHEAKKHQCSNAALEQKKAHEKKERQRAIEEREAAFAVQLKEMREKFKSEYEIKIKEGLEELNQFKIDFEQQFQEKQVRINQLHERALSEKSEEIDQLRQTIAKCDEKLKESKQLAIQHQTVEESLHSTIALKDQEIKRLSQQLSETKLGLETAYKYMTSVKQQNESLKIDIQDCRIRANQVQSQDWAKKNVQMVKELELLRAESSLKNKEMQDLKHGIKLAIQADNRGGQQHFQNLLETQSIELCRLRRLVEEHEKRERQCQRKWNLLLSENLHLQEQVQHGKSQLQRQKDQLQNVIVINERKLIEANQRLASVQTCVEKRCAAEYLVDQIRVHQEEKEQLISDNQSLAEQVASLFQENQRIQRECNVFLMAREPVNSEADPHAVAIFNTQKLVHRIEELEDLVVELKTQCSADEIVTLKNVIQQQAQDLSDLQLRVKELSKQKVKSINLFENNELYGSFQQVMQERDQLISALVNEVKEAHASKLANGAQTDSERAAAPLDLNSEMKILQGNMEIDASRLNEAINRMTAARHVQRSSTEQTGTFEAKKSSAASNGLYGLAERDDWLLEKSPQTKN